MPFPLTDVIVPVCSALGAAGTGDLVFWTEPELYLDAGRALEELARKCRAFVAAESLTTAPGTAIYNTTAGAVEIIAVAYAGQELKPTTTAEMDALDPAWRTETGTPRRWVANEAPFAGVRLYPVPDAAGALLILANVRPTTPTTGAPTVQLPAPLSPYLTLQMIAGARAREGRAAMPEVATMAEGMASILEQAAQAYYGGGDD